MEILSKVSKVAKINVAKYTPGCRSGEDGSRILTVLLIYPIQARSKSQTTMGKRRCQSLKDLAQYACTRNGVHAGALTMNLRNFIRLEFGNALPERRPFCLLNRVRHVSSDVTVEVTY